MPLLTWTQKSLNWMVYDRDNLPPCYYIAFEPAHPQVFPFMNGSALFTKEATKVLLGTLPA